MIVFDIDGLRFSYRVAALIFDSEGKKILLTKNMSGESWFLPGGRVEAFEFSSDSIIREIKEETQSDIIIDRPIFFVENLFDAKYSKMHEIGVYYLAHFDKDSDVLKKEEFFNKEEDDRLFIFKWFDIDEVEHLDFRPSFLKDKLKKIPDCIEFVEVRD